jgi:carbonic anhydrase/acetyltransferase-like protein (isoleucine patch superfamily)
VVVLGDVEIEDDANIWFHTVIRADVNIVRIGARTNIQDLCMLHVTSDRFPLHIGADVVVGHRAVLHGCTVEDGALIGIGALVLDGARVCAGAILGAGAVAPPGSVIPENTVALGIPARPVRTPTDEDRAFHSLNIDRYMNYGRNFSELAKII